MPEGRHLLRAGEIATTVFFVKRGLLREYYLARDGGESTRSFRVEGDFSGSLADLLNPRPAAVSVETLEPSEIFSFKWRPFDALSEKHPCLMKLLRRFAEGLYVKKTAREFEMLTMPAERRFVQFMSERPDVAERVPRRLIASYLGITAVHLSRIFPSGKAPRSRSK